MIWLVFLYGWSSPLLQIPHSLHCGENLCGKQKNHWDLHLEGVHWCEHLEGVHIIPFLAVVPHLNTGLQKLKTAQAALSLVKSKILWVWGEQRCRNSLFLVWLDTSMAWTRQPEVIGHVLVCCEFEDEVKIPRWVKKEGAQGGVHPSHPAGVLSSWRPVWWCLVGLAASSALPCSVSATWQVLDVSHSVGATMAQTCSVFAPRFFFRLSISSFGVLYC